MGENIETGSNLIARWENSYPISLPHLESRTACVPDELNLFLCDATRNHVIQKSLFNNCFPAIIMTLSHQYVIELNLVLGEPFYCDISMRIMAIAENYDAALCCCGDICQMF